jgi:hypothetical protein
MKSPFAYLEGYLPLPIPQSPRLGSCTIHCHRNFLAENTLPIWIENNPDIHTKIQNIG